MGDLTDVKSAERASNNNTGGVCSDSKRLESTLPTVSLDFDEVTYGVIQAGLLFIIHNGGAGSTLDPTQKLHILTRFELVLEHIFLDGVLIGRLIREND